MTTAEEPATSTYSVSEPFEQTVKLLRKVLTERNLKLAGELDMSSRIRHTLLIRTAPCRVLFVTAEPAAIGEPHADPCAATLTPLHIVVSARGAQTDIHLLRTLPAQGDETERPAIAAIRELQGKITQAIERIGMRTAFGA